jgi:hypothetical protein
MRVLVVLVALILTLSESARADPPPGIAIFDFELIDTSLQGSINGPRPDEHDRLMRISDQLRKSLANSGKFHVLDISRIDAAAHASHLQACGGCDVELARKIGADLDITGTVQKVSNLILNVNIYLRDVHTGRLITSMSVDMRGNTDESWSRAVDYLVRNRLLASNYGAPRPQ